MDTEKFKKNVIRFFSNPNTLTFIFAIVAIVVLYKVYSYMVDNAVQPTNVYYANTNLFEDTQITSDVVNQIEISGSFLSSQGGALAQNYNQIYNKYVAKGYRIPENSFFYNEALTSEDADDITPFTNIKDNYTIFRLSVNFHNTLGCSIMDGDYIDIFLKTNVKEGEDGEELLVYNMLVKSIQVLLVVDDEGENVFTTTADGEKLEPKYIYFAVPIETYKLLEIAQRGSQYDIELVPVPRDSSYSENPEEPSIANAKLEDLIYSQASAWN